MKATWICFVRWMCWAGAVVAVLGPGMSMVQAQNLLSYETTNHRQTTGVSSSAADTVSPVMTPEVTAEMMMVHGQYMNAVRAFKKLQPQTADTYDKIGIAYQHLSMNADARFYYNMAIKANRRFAPAYNNLGTVAYLDRDNRAAERYFKKAIRIDPKTASFWSNLGAVYLDTQRYRDGAEAYQRAFTLNSEIFQEISMNGFQQATSAENLARVYLCFAEIYAKAGMKQQAVEYLRKAMLEGMRDRQKFEQDVQLATLRGTPEFESLFAKQQSR